MLTSAQELLQVCVSQVALTQLCWLNTMDTPSDKSSEIENEVPNVEAVLQTLRIRWYKPKYLIRGLMVAYLRHCIQQHDFSASKIQNRTQSKI
ncbi:hypothetical protein C6497_06850 [Candidatus Poribacteria bacterium]|nr:MAG: hypothetical protein C6497_06850 [Candidatus Poribacteria bacterium]